MVAVTATSFSIALAVRRGCPCSLPGMPSDPDVDHEGRTTPPRPDHLPGRAIASLAARTSSLVLGYSSAEWAENPPGGCVLEEKLPLGTSSRAAPTCKIGMV